MPVRSDSQSSRANEASLNSNYQTPSKEDNPDAKYEPSIGHYDSIFKDTSIQPHYIKDCGCPSILIVDDQYINRFIIQQFCDKYGIRWTQAEDGQEAIDVIKEEHTKACCNGIKLVLMDLNMPVLGGIEAAKKIRILQRKREISRDLTIVAVTAFPSESEKDKCFSVGMKQFFVKPFTITNFLKLIST